jgi:hypothetical protein
MEVPHENWLAINYAPMQRSRGLPKNSLAKLLNRAR